MLTKSLLVMHWLIFDYVVFHQIILENKLKEGHRHRSYLVHMWTLLGIRTGQQKSSIVMEPNSKGQSTELYVPSETLIVCALHTYKQEYGIRSFGQWH